MSLSYVCANMIGCNGTATCMMVAHVHIYWSIGARGKAFSVVYLLVTAGDDRLCWGGGNASEDMVAMEAARRSPLQSIA